MRITDIRCYVIDGEHPATPFRWRKGLPGSGDGTPRNQKPRAAILRMDTDEGVTGALKIGDGDAVASLTRRRLKPLIGEDPLMTERLWTRIWEIDRIEEMNMAHLGLIDQLAWDIKSRKAGLPLYQLIGGNASRVPAYASTVTWETMGEYERHIKECVDEGFVAFKLHAWGDPAEDAKLCRNLRLWTGDDAILMFDGSAGWDLPTSLRVGRVLEEAGFYWYEEPMREFNLAAYRKLAADLDIPVLAAETSDGAHWNAATWIDDEALDMVRTSSFYKGGITGALKIAHLAESHAIKAQVHGMGMANAHLCAAIPNNDFYEQLVYSSEHIATLKSRRELPIVEGHILVPDAPGLGLDCDWTALDRTALAIV
ncbi:MAG TPA: enolase C-terminal domain-like protein [Roseiarcus sp.]|nr:enolase C-terminal domain-like protein [Roseiarcus sp.]